MSISELERCWITHKRKPYWNECPLCGKPLKWVRLWSGEFSPCDEEPVLYAKSKSGKLKIVARRDIVESVTTNIPLGEKPKYGRIPHYYTCPVLVKERREWAKNNKGW